MAATNVMLYYIFGIVWRNVSLLPAGRLTGQPALPLYIDAGMPLLAACLLKFIAHESGFAG